MTARKEESPPDPRQIAFGKRVRELRKARKLTLEKLAERAGLHPTYVGGIERGERNPAVVSIMKLAEGLDAEPGELFPPMKRGRR